MKYLLTGWQSRCIEGAYYATNLFVLVRNLVCDDVDLKSYTYYYRKDVMEILSPATKFN